MRRAPFQRKHEIMFNMFAITKNKYEEDHEDKKNVQ